MLYIFFKKIPHDRIIDYSRYNNSCIGGLVVAIAIKSNLVFGFLNNIDKTIYVSAFIGICAGASEAIIPSLIKQLEAKSTSNSANHES